MYLRISVEVSDVEPNVTISPAACQVVPDVSRSRSSEHDVLPAHVRQVVGDRAADDAAADDDDAGPCGQLGHRRIIPCHAVNPQPPTCLLQMQPRADRSRQNGSRELRYGRRLDETTLRGLYATVPTEFVAARNALVKELRRAKERDEAALVAALRRPDWTDWALNVVAAEHADAVDEVRDARPAMSVTRRRRRSRAVTGSTSAPRCEPCANGRRT